VSETDWDRFKISPQPDAPLLIEALRTRFSLGLWPSKPSTNSVVECDVHVRKIEIFPRYL